MPPTSPIGFFPLLLVLCWVDNHAAAHPFHISNAEMEFDAKSDRLEVSLKLHAVDLEQALSKRAGRKIDVEKEEIAPLVVEYLEANFYLINSSQVADLQDDASSASSFAGSSGRSKVRFVGHELKATWLWVFFELELPSEKESLLLFNTVLFDTTHGQINTVSVRHAGRRFALKTTEQDPSEVFKIEWLQQ